MNLLISLIDLFVRLYSYCLIAYIILTWVPQIQNSPLFYFLRRISEPYLTPFRRIVPSIGILNISPIVALFTLFLAKEGLLVLLDMSVS